MMYQKKEDNENVQFRDQLSSQENYLNRLIGVSNHET